MSTDATVSVQHVAPIDTPLALKDLSILLVKHYGLNEGTFDLMLEYQIGTGAIGPDKDNLIPGAMIGVSRIGLVPTSKVGPTTVDASVVNPAKKPRKKVG